jgi:hypothetical protein
MSSTLLHQAVQLAQAGQKAQARQLILQFLQTEPNNETAWLWLASVAADQTEYQRALNEVLRLNPSNQRAQQLLTEFEQQYGSAARYAPPQQPGTPPPSASPYAPPQQQVGTPPPVSPYAPPQQQVSPPSPVSPYAPPQSSGTPPYAMQQPVSPPPTGVPYSPSGPIEVKVKAERRRGCVGCSVPGCGCLGCGGCGQGCILALLVLVIIPAVLCGGLSLSSISLGPFDLPASFLPGEMGRKDIKFTTSTYDISLETPRSWYLVQTNDQMWSVVWSDFLEGTVPFESDTRKWTDLESDPAHQAVIVDVNLVALDKGGDVIDLALDPSTVQADFSCSTVRASHTDANSDYQQVFDYGNGLCGYREDVVQAGPPSRVLKGIDPPAQVRMITFYTPVSSTAALQWQISIPEVIYTWDQIDMKANIQTMIGSVKVQTK